MLSRRLLRVKVMQAVYAYHKNEDMTFQQAEAYLYHIIYKSFELYHLLLLLLIDIRQYALIRIEKGKRKYRPTPEELNPNTRFIENLLLIKLLKNENLNKFIEQKGISWSNHPEIISSLYNEICQSDIYQQYMSDTKTNFENDRKFIVKIFEKVIAQYLPLYSNLEEQSLYWNDESEFVMSMVAKTLKEFKNKKENDQTLLPEYKEDDDKQFVTSLLRKSILFHTEFLSILDGYLQHWDLERLAFLDIVIMEIALTEILEFGDMALKISYNEYIEIAKHYSTPKSGNFINGILEKMIADLKKEGKINKLRDDLLELNLKTS